MAIYEQNNKLAMNKEALQEMIEVAEYCINFEKFDSLNWRGEHGCYGYPGALLLFSIVDAVGGEIIGGGSDSKRNFLILNHPDYYNMKLDENIVEALRKEYRNYLSHNAQIGSFVAMSPGHNTEEVLQNFNGGILLNLKPFLNLSKKVVEDFILKVH